MTNKTISELFLAAVMRQTAKQDVSFLNVFEPVADEFILQVRKWWWETMLRDDVVVTVGG